MLINLEQNVKEEKKNEIFGISVISSYQHTLVYKKGETKEEWPNIFMSNFLNGDENCSCFMQRIQNWMNDSIYLYLSRCLNHFIIQIEYHNWQLYLEMIWPFQIQVNKSPSMGKNSTATALKEPISAATPSSGRKPSNASGLINTGGSRQNALSTKAASSQVNDNKASFFIFVFKHWLCTLSWNICYVPMKLEKISNQAMIYCEPI